MIGLFTVVAGAIVLWIGQGEAVSLGIGFGCLIGGGFAVFEGWAGWCAVRALGFKTKI